MREAEVRKRNEIEKQCMSRPISFDSRRIEEIKIELLLDIRELLIPMAPFVSAEDKKKRYEKGICDDVVDK